ncbi:hypothetical protein C7H84_32735 [Burkholderia sp. Nafp2/4-1b]|uniref:BON domain-containing protein n=1 Tax=Burkholderia sp. Nafp2/4-1b TaxID=2116686 RepID=UPI000EF91E2A|nr:BON domain-containing protein [Burkholderia sp. Nafp2/4-1b]RKT99285.1 hypothetical protein C7H84_32735 [Burkholderia sp. Nafp2/4-1b]
MSLRSHVLAALAVAVFASPAFAQSNVQDSASGAPSLTKEQIRAQMKAERAENRAFSKKVSQVLSRTKGLDGSTISVFGQARTGKVILAGMVMEESQDQIAQDAAAKAPGVHAVTSKLSVYEAH